jgi:hypothetical protein|tara:strand:+ start:156 stop:1277 length:1122 start_codon:yes stop_codon:yes gene_type:complete
MAKIFFLDDIPKNIQILDQKESKIFPLNFKVEKYLESEKIISTDTSKWLNWEDFMFIDKVAIDIPMKWGLMKHLKNNLDFKGINLSLLIEKELFLSLLPLIHRIILIEKIIENTNAKIAVINEKDNTYFGKILKKILKKYNITTEHIDVEKTTKQILKGEKITFGIDFLGKSLDITLKRKYFFILKDLYEKYWDIKFKINHLKIQQNEKHAKNILLLDFQLINYYSFLKGLSNTNYNLIFLNSRRPIIWNQESYKISENINLKKIQLGKKKDDDESKKKIIDIQEYLDKIQEKSIFYIKEDNYSDILKPIILELIDKRISEIIMIINGFEEKLKTQKIDAVVTLDDSQLFERSIILSCKQRNIPIVMIQNGDI